MKQICQRFTVVLIGISFLIITGCATTSGPKHSGFLTDYPVFEPGPKGGVDFLYIKQGVDFSKYDKVMMDHVVFYFKENADYKGVHPEELTELSEAFHKAFIQELKGAYQLVKEPGPGVLRIRTAITKIETSRIGMSAVSTVLPIGLAVSIAKKAATGEHTGVGRAAIEAEFLDAVTNERIGAVIEAKAGGKMDSFSKLGGAKAAFKFWAKRLKVFLDEAHGKK